MNNRNIDVLEHIARYCGQINEAIQIFGNSAEKLKSNNTFKNAVAMCVLQIGELAGHLTDDFKETHPEMPWHDMRSMRNIAAHQYIRFDEDTLWETITEDAPALNAYCQEIISQYTLLEQEANPEADGG